MQTFTIECLSTAQSPITHMKGTAGNVAIINREPVSTPNGLVWLPVISGNALRHRAIREPGIMWLLDEYALVGELSLPQLNFLLHGGNLTQSNARENTRRIAEMQRTWPLLRLLGASLPDQILAGSLDVWRGVLVCEENRKYLGDSLPEKRILPAERYVDEYQYTRSDAKKRAMHKDAGRVGVLDGVETNLMIFSGQCVARGSVWHHGFVLKHVSEIELGALLWSLRLWQQAGGTIGGQAGKGHGRLRCEIVSDADQGALCEAYVSYAREVRDDAVKWLQDAWA